MVEFTNITKPGLVGQDNPVNRTGEVTSALDKKGRLPQWQKGKRKRRDREEAQAGEELSGDGGAGGAQPEEGVPQSDVKSGEKGAEEGRGSILNIVV